LARSVDGHLRRAIETDLAPKMPAPRSLATLTQPVQLTGGIGRVKQKMYILATDPARFTRFYDKLKNDPGWTVHTLPCTHFIQLEMPDELTAILLKAIP
jgi:hypothetical protein